jgi:molybdopterin/thiamine biosynthesis adenylyltransferase
MTDRERFYSERDRRTLEFGVPDVFDVPVGVFVGADAGGTVAGQFAVLAMVNMLARLHRHLSVRIPPAPLHGPSLAGVGRLDEACAAVARSVDPFIRYETDSPCTHAVGLGAAAPAGLPWYAGADGQVALIDRSPVGFVPGDSPSLGAALAACMAASNVLGQVLGHAQRPVRLSAWDLGEGEEAGRGPAILGPVDVGDVLQVGAGGVGSCLAYWLCEFGIAGRWRVLDGDDVELHNTNRSLGLFPADAGWPGGQPRNKAEAGAKLIGAGHEPVWYEQFNQEAFRPDLVLPLANERDVRALIGARGEPLLLHATTSRLWEAQLHRHIPGRDDCITCRMPEPREEVRFACSTVKLREGGSPSTDAALPFLSAAAGLLLLGGLFRLQHGELVADSQNLWAVCFKDARRHGRRAVHHCSGGCGKVLTPGARRKVHAGRRWSHLDPASSA